MYKVINEVLDSYVQAGVAPEDMLDYLNRVEENFTFILAKVRQRCDLSKVEYVDSELQEALKDNVRDRIAFLNDITKGA